MGAPKNEDDEDIDGMPMKDESYDARMDEMTRQRLREIEVKVMCYQDDLESGKVSIRPGWTISEQVAHFRKKMGKKAREAAAVDTTPTGSGSYGTPPGRGGYNSDQETSSVQRSSRNKKKKSRRRSSSSSRSRSRSRERSRRSSHRSRNISGSSPDESNRRS